MHFRETIVSLALAASLGLAACGGDGDSGLSRSDLTAKADSICSKATADVDAVNAPRSLADANVAAAYFDKVGPILQKETQDLADLEPAKDVKSDWEEFVAKQRAADDLLQTVRKKAHAKDPSGLKDLQKISVAGNAVHAAATKVGATECAI